MPDDHWTTGSGVFDTVADTYEFRAAEFPSAVFGEIAAITGLDRGSTILEIGPGTGKATIRLAQLGAKLVAVEPGPALVEVLTRRVGAFRNVTVVTARFEDWEPHNQRFDAVVAASSWHWLEPTTRWQKAHDVLKPSGWLVLLGHIVVREPGEPEVYAETADLHQAHAPSHPSWGHPPTAREVIAAAQADTASIIEVERIIGRAPDPSEADDLFEPPLLRWYPQVQHFNAHGYVELLRTTSLYGSLTDDVREPLLSAIEHRIRDRLHDHATRRYVISVRLAHKRS